MTSTAMPAGTALTIADITSTNGQFTVDRTTASHRLTTGGTASFTVGFQPAAAGQSSATINVMLEGVTPPVVASNPDGC